MSAGIVGMHGQGMQDYVRGYRPAGLPDRKLNQSFKKLSPLPKTSARAINMIQKRSSPRPTPVTLEGEIPPEYGAEARGERFYSNTGVRDYKKYGPKDV